METIRAFIIICIVAWTSFVLTHRLAKSLQRRKNRTKELKEEALLNRRNKIGNQANRQLERRLSDRSARTSNQRRRVEQPSKKTVASQDRALGEKRKGCLRALKVLAASLVPILYISGGKYIVGFISGLTRNPQGSPSQQSPDTRKSPPGSVSPHAPTTPLPYTTEIDPAVKIKERFLFYPDGRFTYLNSEGEYSKTVGDLARIQSHMLTSRTNARNFPQILVGLGKFTGQCDIGESTLGTYFSKPGCNTIQINFESNGLEYEKPIEVITVLAHEYAHHLTEITVGLQNISGLEAELIADCFAGVVHGYWDKYGKITEDDLRFAVTMMNQVSKQEQLNTSDMHGDPGQRIGAFLAGANKASGKDTPQFQNFCKGLERVIDFSKGLP